MDACPSESINGSVVVIRKDCGRATTTTTTRKVDRIPWRYYSIVGVAHDDAVFQGNTLTSVQVRALFLNGIRSLAEGRSF